MSLFFSWQALERLSSQPTSSPSTTFQTAGSGIEQQLKVSFFLCYSCLLCQCYFRLIYAFLISVTLLKAWKTVYPKCTWLAAAGHVDVYWKNSCQYGHGGIGQTLRLHQSANTPPATDQVNNRPMFVVINAQANTSSNGAHPPLLMWPTIRRSPIMFWMFDCHHPFCLDFLEVSNKQFKESFLLCCWC